MPIPALIADLWNLSFQLIEGHIELIKSSLLKLIEISPDKLFATRFRQTRLVRLNKDAGISPKNAFPYKQRFQRSAQEPRSDGRGPCKAFHRLRKRSSVRFLIIPVEISPVNEHPGRRRPTNLFFLQKTPSQPQGLC